jgi:UrcA family protein
MKLQSALFAAAAIGASALAVTVAAGPVHAAEVVVTARADVPTAVVRYSDLNLASETGKQRLKYRVKFAANQLCGNSTVKEYHVDTEIRDCRATVFASAEPQMEQLFAASDRGERLALGDVGEMTLSAK